MLHNKTSQRVRLNNIAITPKKYFIKDALAALSYCDLL